MAWNRQRLQRAVDRKRVAPRHLSDALSTIGPVGHKHINFRGVYRFPIERYSARLFWHQQLRYGIVAVHRSGRQF